MSIKLIEIKHVQSKSRHLSKDIQCTFDVDGKKRRIRTTSKDMTVSGDLWCNGMGLDSDDGTYATVNLAGVGTVKMRVGDTYTGMEM